MTPESLLILFFLFVTGAVVLAGYVFVIRPSAKASPHIPAEIALDGREMPAAQAAVADVFRLTWC